MDKDVEAAISEDGGLYDLGWYLAWNVGYETACLDGDFTAQQLHDIASHMEWVGGQ